MYISDMVGKIVNQVVQDDFCWLITFNDGSMVMFSQEGINKRAFYDPEGGDCVDDIEQNNKLFDKLISTNAVRRDLACATADVASE